MILQVASPPTRGKQQGSGCYIQQSPNTYTLRLNRRGVAAPRPLKALRCQQFGNRGRGWLDVNSGDRENWHNWGMDVGIAPPNPAYDGRWAYRSYQAAGAALAVVGIAPPPTPAATPTLLSIEIEILDFRPDPLELTLAATTESGGAFVVCRGYFATRGAAGTRPRLNSFAAAEVGGWPSGFDVVEALQANAPVAPYPVGVCLEFSALSVDLTEWAQPTPFNYFWD